MPEIVTILALTEIAPMLCRMMPCHANAGFLVTSQDRKENRMDAIGQAIARREEQQERCQHEGGLIVPNRDIDTKARRGISSANAAETVRHCKQGEYPARRQCRGTRFSWAKRASSWAQFSSFSANLRCLRETICYESSKHGDSNCQEGDAKLTSSKSANLSWQFSQYPGFGSRFCLV